ncbi:MAG TPA: Crp/Fnr family transcriptional regulator [Crenalkalicoccus sp.]|jgi:CRP-like cAMP-binding protein|nr:Crp/Fnr family transcriptional regulator [Crenalkalicoccus sp.]
MNQLVEHESRLARFPLLRDAAPAALAEAARRARWCRAQPGEVVVDYGDVSDDVFLILAGSVRVALRTPAGQELIVGEREAGEVFGEMAAIDGETRSANVTALHTAQLCILPGPVFLHLVLQSPPVAHRLMRMLTARLRLEDTRLMEMVALPVRYRLYSELLRMARPREDGALRVSPPPPQHVIAARIGARREAVSRELTAMSRQGLAVVTRQSIALPKPEALRAAIAATLAGDAPEEGRTRRAG